MIGLKNQKNFSKTNVTFGESLSSLFKKEVYNYLFWKWAETGKKEVARL